MKTFGERLRHIRMTHDLTQSKLAKILDVHFQSVLRYEKNLVMPSSDTLLKLKEHFNVNPNWLLFGSEPKYFSGVGAETQVAYEDMLSSRHTAQLVREPYSDYRILPPANALVEVVQVPIIRQLDSLIDAPPLKKTAVTDELLLPKAWFMSPETTCLAEITTDALRSMLKIGDLLALDWSQRGAGFTEGSIVAIKWQKHVALKRFNLMPSSYLFEDDSSDKPLVVAKDEGCPILARGLFVFRRA